MKTSTNAGVSLNEAATLLKQALGDAAPARITLHRHSASGALSRMIVRRTKARSYYNINALISHYSPVGKPPSAQATAATGPTKAPPAPAQSAPLLLNTQETAQALVQQVAPLIEKQIAQALQPIAEMLRRIDGGLNDLAGTRTMLMMKYDAAATLTNQKLEAARAEVARLKGSTDLDQQIHRIRLDVSRLVDAVSRLQPTQD